MTEWIGRCLTKFLLYNLQQSGFGLAYHAAGCETCQDHYDVWRLTPLWKPPPPNTCRWRAWMERRRDWHYRLVRRAARILPHPWWHDDE